MDSPLHSVHLTNPLRRDEFRHARAALLRNCGGVTLAGAPLPAVGPGGTEPAGLLPAPECVLEDGTFVFALKVGINSVGRLPDNDVVLRSGAVSRRHCAVLVHTDGRCEVYDTASKNGTIVNGEEISGSLHLRSGDRIELSDCVLTFRARRSGQVANTAAARPLHRPYADDQTMAE